MANEIVISHMKMQYNRENFAIEGRWLGSGVMLSLSSTQANTSAAVPSECDYVRIANLDVNDALIGIWPSVGTLGGAAVAGIPLPSQAVIDIAVTGGKSYISCKKHSAA